MQHPKPPLLSQLVHLPPETNTLVADFELLIQITMRFMAADSAWQNMDAPRNVKNSMAPPSLTQPQVSARAEAWLLAKPRKAAAYIIAGILFISGLLWLLPPNEVETQNFLHHLNIIPLLLAGLLFGWRAAVAGMILAAIAEAPYIWASREVSSYNAADLLVELTMYGVAGVVAGILADRGRRQNAELEKAATELATVYQELTQNVERLKKAERLYAAGQLSSSLAHEIRNPLASISGAASLLKRATPESEKFSDCLEIIDKESLRLNKLLTHFLEFAIPRPLRFQPADLKQIIQSVVTLCAHQAHPGIHLQQRVDPHLAEIECDPEQLKQVLINLTLNAIQATSGAGSIVVSALAQSPGVVISVGDEGCGLSADQLNRIFDPFFTTKENGSGLGLAISAKIVAQHGGQLLAESNPDKGMTFRLELPQRGNKP